jgi:AraC-like DNA-binding protein
MRTLCGPNWQPLQTHLAQRRPADIRPYQAVFGEAVSFDAEDAALFFDAAWLAHPVAGADAELQRLLLGIVNGGAGNAARTFRDDVRALLAGMIGDADVSQATVARIFNISSSTLHRRLAAEGTNFQDLLDDTRADIACRLLGDTTLPLAQISSMLGYSEASAFTRWFKRRMGAAPTDWRATRTGAHAAAAAQ